MGCAHEAVAADTSSMTRPTDEQIAKLPMWARDYISTLRNQIEGLTESIVTTSRVHPRAEFFIDNGFNAPMTAMPRDVGLRVKWPDAYIDLRMHSNQYNPNERLLRLIGSKGIVIRPDSSNVIEVTP